MNEALLYPVFVQIALTLVLTLATAYVRFVSVSKADVRVKDIVLGQRNWPRKVQQLSNALNNQWETPVLFYAGVAFALITSAQSALLLPSAWAFVIFRLLHAGVYVVNNFLPVRFGMFIVSTLSLFVFWAVFAMEILSR